MRFQNLDLDTLRTLVVANDLGGYGQAAKRLGRTPSAISLQMKRLQEDVGVPLFRRSGRGLALTEAGELTLRIGRRMLALNDDLIEAMRGSALAGPVRNVARTLVAHAVSVNDAVPGAIGIDCVQLAGG